VFFKDFLQIAVFRLKLRTFDENIFMIFYSDHPPSRRSLNISICISVPGSGGTACLF
jgi:hypothetical protein